MQLATRLASLTALVGAALVLASACDDRSAKTLDPESYYGGWLPCVDEDCTTLGTDGIAFAEDRWFYRITAEEDAPLEELGPLTVSAAKECCWKTEPDHIVLDLATNYHLIWSRFEGDDQLQIEVLHNKFFDEETEEPTVTECHEGDQFDPADAGVEDGGPDPWTAEDCWSPFWKPLGRALRVLTPAEVEVLTYEVPEQDTDE